LTQTCWEELERGFREFSNRLTQHEYRENDLLSRAHRQPAQDDG
jgi:hypothetical protein